TPADPSLPTQRTFVLNVCHSRGKGKTALGPLHLADLINEFGGIGIGIPGINVPVLFLCKRGPHVLGVLEDKTGGEVKGTGMLQKLAAFHLVPYGPGLELLFFFLHRLYFVVFSMFGPWAPSRLGINFSRLFSGYRRTLPGR